MFHDLHTAMTMFPRIVAHLALLTGAVVMATEQCQYCAPDQQCWPSFQQLVDFNKTLDGYALYPSQPEYRYSTLKLVLSGHSKRPSKLVFNIDYRLMQVNFFAFCNTFGLL